MPDIPKPAVFFVIGCAFGTAADCEAPSFVPDELAETSSLSTCYFVSQVFVGDCMKTSVITINLPPPAPTVIVSIKELNCWIKSTRHTPVKLSQLPSFPKFQRRLKKLRS